MNEKNQKYFPPLIRVVLLIWRDFFTDFSPVDQIYEDHVRKIRSFGGRDRRWIAETAFAGVRWWRSIWFLLDRQPDLSEQALFQFWCVLEWHQTSVLPQISFQQYQGLQKPPGSGITALHEEALIFRKKILSSDFATWQSIPDWLHTVGLGELGADTWQKCMIALNERPLVDLRCSTGLVSLGKVQASLAQDQIQTLRISGTDAGLSLVERKNVFITEAYRKGWIEVQDRASQLVAPMLKLQPGMRVVDACAGAGGKTLHIADLMKNQGKLIALDTSMTQLNKLKQRIKRYPQSNIEVRHIENSKVIKRLAESADCLLLDVPCTGLGVLRRHVGSRWTLSPEKLAKLQNTQFEILNSYWKMTRPGGVMVYATCSFLPSENHNQVQKFLDQNNNFILEEEKTIFPFAGAGDGFYMARLRRNP